MSKKRNGNSFWSNGPDSELIARFTGFLKQVLLNERSTYLKNLKKKELNECSFEELEEKGQFQKQFAVDEVENILMWEANTVSFPFQHPPSVPGGYRVAYNQEICDRCEALIRRQMRHYGYLVK